MATHFVFADEAGCFKFETSDHASRYFILCTIRMENCEVGAELMDYRRYLMATKQHDGEMLHCTTDPQRVRDEVFAILQRHKFSIDSTVLEKRKAQPQVRTDQPTFYRYAWYYHARHLLPKRFKVADDVLISAAALDTAKGKAAFKNAFNEVIQQTGKHLAHSTAFHFAKTDPCLQAADYCAWAIQRKWERDDRRSYDLVSDKITSEFDLWRFGSTTYY